LDFEFEQAETKADFVMLSAAKHPCILIENK